MAGVGLSQKIHSFKSICWGAGWLFFCVLALSLKGQPAGFDFASFSSSAPLLWGGSSSLESNRIIIAQGGDFRAGAVWYRDPVFVQGGFECTFRFRATGTEKSRGFALVLHAETLPGLGTGDGMGYEGLKNSLAVEFDFAPDANYLELATPHVSVQSRGIYVNSSRGVVSLGASTNAVSQLNDGSSHDVRIRYAGGVLEIIVDGQPALAVELQLAGLLRLQHGQAWIGFTAGSAATEGPVEVLAWSFLPATGPLAVTITSPVNDQQIVAGTNLLLMANATSLTGSVARVAFFSGNEFIGQASVAPFKASWTNTVPGSHILQAIAYDAGGNFAPSPPVRVSILPVSAPIAVNLATGFGGTNFNVSALDAAGLVRQTNWNNALADANAGGALLNAQSASGMPTSLGLTYKFIAPGEETAVNPSRSPDHQLMRACLVDHGHSMGQTNSTISVTEIPFPVYDLILYSDGGNGAQERIVEFRVGERLMLLRDASWTAFSGHYAEARGAINLGSSTPMGNYVRFRGLTNRNVNVVVSDRSSINSFRRAPVSALQIVPSLPADPPPQPALIRGPYLQSGATRSMTICWRTDLPAPSVVNYGTAPGSLNVVVSNNVRVRDHAVRLTNLQPNTRYYYRIGPGITNPAPQNLTFVTSPQSNRPFRIWAWGDGGAGDHSAAAVRDSYLAYAEGRPPDLLLLLGDNAYEGGSDPEYQVALFEMLGPMLSQTVMWSCMGNHETYSQDLPYLNIFNFPTDGRSGGVPSGSELYYSFNYANAHFVCLESTLADRTPTGPMATWLRADLGANTNEWLIVYFHAPPYSKGSHDSDAEWEIEMADMRANIVPILEEYGVDLVLSGNSHGYERSFLVDGHHGFSDSFLPSMIKQGGSGRPEDTGAYTKPLRGAVPHSGAVYVVAGHGSVIRSHVGMDHPAMFTGVAELGSVVIDIDGPTLEFRMLRENGSIGDYFTIQKGIATNLPPVISVAAVDENLDEAASAGTSLLLSRDAPGHDDLQIFYNLGGEAANGADYGPQYGSALIPAGDTQTVVPIVPIDDALPEPAEQLSVTVATNTAPFTLVFLPDTRAYAAEEQGGTLAMLTAQTRWIAERSGAEAIRFALHAGNLTSQNTAPEWQRLLNSFLPLRGRVPYALALGERDGLSSATSQTTLFNSHFPLTSFQQSSTFGGAFEPGRSDNLYFYFTAGGIDWLVVTLEFGPRDAVLTWANRLIAAHPARKVIVLTHAQLGGDDVWHGASPEHQQTPAEFGRRNNGMDLWRKLLRRHANIALVLSGSAEDGSGRRVDPGDYGNKVVQIAADFSGQLNGGNGYLHLLEFLPAEDKLLVRKYSPYLNAEGDAFEVHELGLFKPWHSRYVLGTPDTATITLLDNDLDAVGPSVTAITSIGESNQVLIAFSEPIDPATAQNVDNYNLGPGIIVLNAQLQADGRSVLLTTEQALPEGSPSQLIISGILDRAIPPNVLSTSTNAFTHRLAWLFDDFNDGNLTGWLTLDEGTIDAPSVWSVPAGKLDQSSSIYGTGRKGTMALWSGPEAFDWANYSFKATLRTPDPDGIGVVFRYLDTNNLYRLELDARLSVRKLVLIADGAETILAAESGGFPLNEDFVLQVEVYGTGIYATLNGQPLFEGVVSNRALSQGTVGLYCWRSAGATFDDVEVTPLRTANFSSLINPTLLSSGQFEFDLIGPAGALFSIEASSDLKSWTPVLTVTNGAPNYRFSAPATSGGLPQFYRARRLP